MDLAGYLALQTDGGGMGGVGGVTQEEGGVVRLNWINK